MQRTMGRLAVVSFLVAWVSDSHAADDTVLTWLAAGSKGAACALPSNDPCINAQGLACIFSTCTTARSIADDRCVGSTTNYCNPCVNNVRQQFDDMFATGWWTNGSWHYSDGTRYQPSNLTPGAVYDDGKIDRARNGRREYRQNGANAVHSLDDVCTWLPVQNDEYRRPAIGRSGIAQVLHRVGHVGDIR